MSRPFLSSDYFHGHFGDEFAQLGGDRVQEDFSHLGVAKLRADEAG
jgi:hypothetical protein